MIKKTTPALQPTGWKKYLWRAPIIMYRWGLGPLLGNRFLLLNHVGRKSGMIRQAVLEIDAYDAREKVYLIASGFGKKSDWYRNLHKTPEASIQVGSKKMRVRAELLSSQRSGQEMMRYAREHPQAAQNLARIMGLQLDAPDDLEAWRTVGEQYVPFVALHVVDVVR